MTPERWREIERIYQEALDQDPSARSSFIDRACTGDPDLQREVLSLLAAHRPDDHFLESSALDVAARALAGEMPALARGRRLGAYELISPLGAGGMGEVWRANDPALHRDVAIKVLPPAFARDPDRLRRFEQEARAAAMLAHPNILAVYATGTEEGAPYLVTELLEGSTLRERLGAGALPEGKAIEYAIEIANGLAAAHEKGLVHRDLKPENVFITSDGRVKILDFGLAKLVHSRPGVHGPTHTASGIAIGTPAYMSPEQIRGQPADHRSDIFAFGAVLYEMLERRRPFAGDSSVETMNAILAQDPAPLARASPLVEQIVRHCLEKEPGERFQSARDLGFHLRLARHPSAQAPVIPPATRKRWWYGVAALAVIVLAVAAPLVWRQRQDPANPTLTITRLTSYSGLTTDAAVSPDGSLLAYASDRSGGGSLDIWVQQVGKAEAIRLTSDPADEREPSFSPDGTRIAFRSEKDGGGIYVVSVLGGSATRIVTGGRRPRFSPDGKRIAYWSGLIGREIVGGSRTYVVGASGGAHTRIADDFAIARHPLWAPDGRHLLFLGSREPIESFALSQGSSWDWWMWPLEGGAPVRTGAIDVLRSVGLGVPVPSAWDRDGRVLFAADLGDTRNIWQVRLSPEDGHVVEGPRRLTSGAGIEDLPATSGDRVVFSSFIENADVWSVPVDARRGTATGPLERLTDNAAVDVQPAISGDGRRLAFTSNRAGNFDVFTKDLERGEEVPLTISPTFESRPAISADGSLVAYNEGPIERRRVHVSSLRDSSGPVALNVCEDCFVPWDWSPDNRYLLYWPQKRRQIGLLDVQSRQTAIILAHDQYTLLRCSFSPDGRWVVFHADVGTDRSQMFVAPFRGMSPIDRTSWIEVTNAEDRGYIPRWSPDGKALYFLSNIDGYSCLWRQPLDPETKRPVGDPAPLYHLHGARRSVSYLPPGFQEISIAPTRIVFSMTGRTGNLWMAEWKP